MGHLINRTVLLTGFYRHYLEGRSNATSNGQNVLTFDMLFDAGSISGMFAVTNMILPPVITQQQEQQQRTLRSQHLQKHLSWKQEQVDCISQQGGSHDTLHTNSNCEGQSLSTSTANKRSSGKDPSRDDSGSYQTNDQEGDGFISSISENQHSNLSDLGMLAPQTTLSSPFQLDAVVSFDDKGYDKHVGEVLMSGMNLETHTWKVHYV